MAFVIRKPGQRFEIRESRHTPAGPRSKTLASFRILNRNVLRLAASRSAAPIDEASIARRAAELGAQVELVADVTEVALGLVESLRRGDDLKPGAAAMLKAVLGCRGGQVDDAAAQAAAEWIGTSDAKRGEALVELLLLGEQLPRRDRGEMAFPPIGART